MRNVRHVILGIDPGLATTGYGVLSTAGKTVQCLTYGTISTPAHSRHTERLHTIFDRLSDIVRDHRPDIVAVEKLFFARNVKTAFSVGEARGVAFLALDSLDITIAEYSPLQVKQAIVGYGKADKRQVGKMVRLHLGLKEIPRPDDAADALAIALCWYFTAPSIKTHTHATAA